MNQATPTNLKLTIENTEALHKQALAVTDNAPYSDEITELMADALIQIERDSGQPANASDDEGEFMAQLQTVVDTVKQLQEEA